MRDWIKTENSLPEKGKKVLVWYGEGCDRYDIAAVDEYGVWTGLLGEGAIPVYWMAFPAPPSGTEDVAPAANIKGEVKDGRLLFDIAEDKESVAELMQCYINGEVAVINGEGYLVADMKSEIIGEKVISIFSLRRPVSS
jgi:hypothetical protein